MVLAHKLREQNVRISVKRVDEHMNIDLERLMLQRTAPVGALLDAGCDVTARILSQVNSPITYIHY